jgi:hypothetical protein
MSNLVGLSLLARAAEGYGGDKEDRRREIENIGRGVV